MQWVDLSARQRARRRYAVMGAVIVASLAGLLVGWSEAQSKDLTPAEVVALRFPSAWSNLPARSASAVTAVAKNQILFDPNPSYELASADSKPVIPSGVLAYGDPIDKEVLDRFPNVNRKMQSMDLGGTVPMFISERADITSGVERGSGRSRRSVRKT